MSAISTSYPIQEYVVLVTNEVTREERTVTVPATSQVDAQVHALHIMFKQSGWRHCTCGEAVDTKAPAFDSVSIGIPQREPALSHA